MENCAQKTGLNLTSRLFLLVYYPKINPRLFNPYFAEPI